MSAVKRLSWNDAERRLRFLWRFLIFLLIFIPIVTLAQMALYFLAPGLVDALQTENADLQFLKGATISEWLVLAGLVVTLLIIGRWVDRRPWADYGFHLGKRWWLDLLFGLFLGALLMSGIFLVEYLLGWVTIAGVFQTFDGLSFWQGILWPVALFLAVGIFEELLSRGYLLTNFAETFNFRFWTPVVALILGWLLSSSLFGLAHIGNPNTSTVSTINLVVAGLFLGLGYILTGDLAIPIGLHITWNFFQGNVFGFPVSGGSYSGVTFIAIEQKGPEMWTGGAFGPEAGLIGLTAIGIGALLILGWVKWRYGRIQFQQSIPLPPQQKTSEAVMTSDA